MLETELLQRHFDRGLPYGAYLKNAKEHHRDAWAGVYGAAVLDDAQRGLVEKFTRTLRILCLSGTWCGDCVQQCPALQRIAEAHPQRVRLRFADRDEHTELAARVAMNLGQRVPTVIFMAEDHAFVSVYGDRTLTRYRALAAEHLGATCPLPGAPVPADETRGVLRDWLDEIERVHLLLLLSPRLRQLHSD